jgi:hypothetical protein
MQIHDFVLYCAAVLFLPMLTIDLQPCSLVYLQTPLDFCEPFKESLEQIDISLTSADPPVSLIECMDNCASPISTVRT